MPLCNGMSIYFFKTKVVIATCHGPAVALLYDKENRNSGGRGETEGRRPLRRSRRRWEDNTKMDLQDVRWGG